jgi:hypothetical protein
MWVYYASLAPTSYLTLPPCVHSAILAYLQCYIGILTVLHWYTYSATYLVHMRWPKISYSFYILFPQCALQAQHCPNTQLPYLVQWPFSCIILHSFFYFPHCDRFVLLKPYVVPTLHSLTMLHSRSCTASILSAGSLFYD